MGQWFSLNSAKFPQEPLYVGGHEIFPSIKLKDVPKHIIITSFCLDNAHEDPTKRSWEPKIFHNLPCKKATRKDEQDDNDCNGKEKLLWDCVMGSTGRYFIF